MKSIIDASDPIFINAALDGTFRGVVKNLNNNNYHALKKYWSSSALKFMAQSSPAHFRHEFFSVSIEDKKQSDNLIIGSLVHCMMLEPHDFQNNFFHMPDLNLRTNDGKAMKEQLLAENIGKTMYTSELLATAQSIVGRARTNNEIMDLLNPGERELSFFWECPYSGLLFRAKLDQCAATHWCELKTTSDASPDGFSNQIHDLNYDLSLQHYREGMNQVMQSQPPAYMIALETSEPFVNQVYKVGDGFWETGHAKWLDAVNKLMWGLKSNSWHGYFPPSVGAEIQPPPWAINKLFKGAQNGI